MKNYPMHNLTLILIVFLSGKITSSAANKFTFVVLADPQAWRLNDTCDADTNTKNTSSTRGMWLYNGYFLILALRRYYQKNIEFGIINGDITDSGEKEQWEDFLDLYNHLNFPYYYGLGNHDYQINEIVCITKDSRSFEDSAIESIHRMLDSIRKYEITMGKEANFRSDMFYVGSELKGSFSYSWDHKGVHFVQLHNYPTYELRLKDRQGSRYHVTKSLTWLAEDLRQARRRNIKDIIINFHNKDFDKSISMHDRKYFQAIMETYKPLAVFVGHWHVFNKYSRHSFFGNTTVYQTGAAFSGLFHMVTYDNGKLIVEEMSVEKYQMEKKGTNIEYPRDHTPTCMTRWNGETVIGSIYSVDFIPRSRRLYLSNRGKYLYSVSDKLFLTEHQHFDIFSNYNWHFDVYEGYDGPEFWRLYRIVNTDSRVLTTDDYGNLSAKLESNRSDPHTLWKIVKAKGIGVMIYNVATNRFLGSDYFDKARASSIYDVENPRQIWEITDSDPYKDYVIENVRYFKSLRSHSYSSGFPKYGNQSDENWQYLGYYDYLKASPCIGW